MEVRGEFAERDYLRAQWLHMKPRRRFRVVGYLVLALFVLALVLVASRVVSEGDPRPAAPLLLATVILAGVAYLHRYLWKRHYRRQPSLQGLQIYSFSPEGIDACSPHGSSQVRWDIFTKWREDSHLFLLYQADNLFCMVPKRWLVDAHQMTELRTLLAERSGPRVV